ncbi:MAG TPA: TetR/AcrR family transcriptional regulator [Tahibacter sp.]|uniref:TetR/AcrR family transcriptional regulator n=1 Tax=Tahibacter sp. TaxID=2056211 RepID=UPI002CCCB64C|nr:TetR/AcrR family transcriptional regulator [Tahibacter sp.]HSX58856.1 TetR/AcrR family transcriptional regulator [Tahibacter sp.]
MPTPPKSATPRRRGRPAAATGPGRDADARAHLLDVALKLFAEHGIAATPLSQIARKARVTPALLHYYFGSKDNLVDALVDERLQPLSAALGQRLANGGGDLRAALEAFVGTILELLAANPWFPQLWLREVLSEGGQLRKRLIERIAPHVAHRVRELVSGAQQQGLLNPDIEPRLLMVSLIGLTVFPLAAQPIWRAIYPSEDITTDVLRRHVLALLLRGLELGDAH